MRSKARKQEDGYCSGVLVHVKLGDPQKELSRIVVPSCRREEVLDIGNRGLVGGHFSHNKMFAILSHHFTWPGKDIRAYSRDCRNVKRQGGNYSLEYPWWLHKPYQNLTKGWPGIW